MRELICPVLGHHWKYNFSTMPNKRICVDCKLRQEIDLSTRIWHDGFDNRDERSDYELIRKWVDIKMSL